MDRGDRSELGEREDDGVGRTVEDVRDVGDGESTFVFLREPESGLEEFTLVERVHHGLAGLLAEQLGSAIDCSSLVFGRDSGVDDGGVERTVGDEDSVGPRGEGVCGGSEDVERDGLIGYGGATGQGTDADQSEELWQGP